MHATLSLPLAFDLSSPAIARPRAVALVAPWASEQLELDLRVLVSEVVTNAVVHGGPNIQLDIAVLTAYWVRVEVFDGSFDLPEMQTFVPDRESGRGLHLVDTLANQWGTRQRVDGKVVWFELHEHASEPRQR
jgi:anti-sigma regulatory factor (Ser/Thr protein kinase)